jgi:hypothetical protein
VLPSLCFGYGNIKYDPSFQGTLLEKYLTMTPEEFSTYMRSEAPPTVDGEKTEEPMREAYRYAKVVILLFSKAVFVKLTEIPKSERFVMRSQLDCVDKRLPGTGVFDVKTRACLPIRMDMLNFEVCSEIVEPKSIGEATLCRKTRDTLSVSNTEPSRVSRRSTTTSSAPPS